MLGTHAETLARVMAAAGAVAIALAGYIGRELLSPTRENEWVRCRALAEALKREVYKGLLRVPPYDSLKAGTALQTRAVELLQNTGLPLDVVDAPDKPLPGLATIDDYIQKRVRDQLSYYTKTAGAHQRTMARFRSWTILLGGAATAMGIIGALLTELALWVPVVTTATVAMTTFVQASRLQGLVPLFQETATQLALTLASWSDGATQRASQAVTAVRDAEIEFVRACEDILSRENDAWRAEWKSKDQKGSIDPFLEAALAAAERDAEEAG